jgi:molecular chaperone GrpE (heat shock protein)
MASISLTSGAMPDAEETNDGDFDAQMRGLFEQAEQVLERRAINAGQKTASATPDSATSAAFSGTDDSPDLRDHTPAAPTKPRYPSLPQMLRPLVMGLEAMTRATGENTCLLNKLDRAADASAEAQHDLPQLIAELRTLLELKNWVNQRMFDALHEELKDYKDHFLLESVHRPIIRDLITLYDDLAEIHRQIEASACELAQVDCAERTQALVERMQTLAMNIEHKLDFIIEVLARLEVTPLLAGHGKLDKLSQRAVALEPAQVPEEDGDIVRSVKRGFSWKERVVRAEEVVVKKWKDATLTTIAPPSEK